MSIKKISKKTSLFSNKDKTSKKSLKKSSKKSLKKSSKKAMPEGYARCMICNKAVKMVNPSVKTTKNGRKMLTGKLECGHHQGNRFI